MKKNPRKVAQAQSACPSFTFGHVWSRPDHEGHSDCMFCGEKRIVPLNKSTGKK